MKKSFLPWVAGYFLASFLDAHSTLSALSLGNVEGNPIIAPFLDMGTPHFYAVRAFFAPLVVSSVMYQVRRRLYRSRFILAVPIVVWMFAVLVNYSRTL